MYESISILDYEAVERVTEQFKGRLYENKVRVTTGNPKGNLSEVTPRNDNGSNNNIINNVRITIDREKDREGKNTPPSGNANNSDHEKTCVFSQVTHSLTKQGYPKHENDKGSLENKGNPDRLPVVTCGYLWLPQA
jgi:hypothetical protein